MSSIGSRPLKSCAAIGLAGDQTFRPRASLRNLAIGQCTSSRIMRIACVNPPAKILHLAANPKAASDFGAPARPNHHLHAPQIADSGTDLRPTKDGVTFGRSHRDIRAAMTLYQRSGPMRSCALSLIWHLPLSGFFLPKPDTAVCSFERLCPAASRDPGSGTSLRLTIP